MAGDDIAFYRRREQQERAIAARSIDPVIVAIHAAMAERYAALIRGKVGEQRPA